MKMQLKPLGSRVLVERDEMKSATASGILLPEVSKEAPREGVVKAVGWKDDAAGKHSVKPGDRVMLPKYGGTEVETLEGERKHTLIEEEDILGILTPVEDDDLDEPLPERTCAEGEACESCT